MSNFNINATKSFFLPEIIWLEPEDFDQAMQISNQVAGEADRWQTYLNALSLFSFLQWLGERSKVLVESKDCSILQPKYANVINAVCNLKVGDFNLCIIATDNLDNGEVIIPRAAIELPEFVAHFYVLIEVLEEQEQVILRGYISYNRLINYCEKSNLRPNQDWSYTLPLCLFNSELNNLLLYLRVLNTDTIPLPKSLAEHSSVVSLTSSDLDILLTNLRSPKQKLWHSLTWEQGAKVLTCPELLELLYQWQVKPESSDSLFLDIKELFNILTQKAVNVALWLQDEIDELARSLGWSLPSSLIPATGWRSTVSFDSAIAELKHRGLKIPPQARGSCQQIILDETSLQLLAATWILPQNEETVETFPEWSLLLILGMPSGGVLPKGIKLQVRDMTNMLCEKELVNNDCYLVARVVGNPDDKFLVTVTLNQAKIQLAPFVFVPNQFSNSSQSTSSFWRSASVSPVDTPSAINFI